MPLSKLHQQLSPAFARTTASRSRPRTDATSTAFPDNEIICAVSEARGIAPTVGLSFVNVSTSEAVLCQFADTQTFARTCHKIKVFAPCEILYAQTSTDSKLLSILIENLEVERNGIQMVSIHRRYWSETAGYEYLHRLAFPDDLESLKLAVAGNFFAICCFSAVLRYIDLCSNVTFAAQTLRIRFETSEGALMIDLSTITSLELVQNLHDAKSKDCLFGLLNETRTKMGARMLKSNILQPSTDTNKIIQRYDSVTELSMKEIMLGDVRSALLGFVDSDKVLAALVVIQRRIDFDYMEQSANHALALKTFIDMILPLWQALSGAASRELLEIRKLCSPDKYADVQDLLKHALNENVHYSAKPAELRNQRVWALKAGYNGFLDVARQTYSEVSDDIKLLANELREEHDLGLELKYDPVRQFLIKIKTSELENKSLPETFINVHRNKNVIECQTMDLIKMNQRLRDAHNEVIVMSDRSIQELITAVRGHIHPLFKISEGIALLDMLSTFAQLATTRNYVRPEILSTLAIKSGRHPICEKLQPENFVPNDVYATEQNRFQIITGCNMSGKTTYLRSIALMTIMAQMGCFVPAEYASFPIMQQVFARTSTDDNIEANVSTFASEMREMAFILHNIEPRSLVIVDELGRGTSTSDGLAIAIAISEALIESKALVWFVTHFRDLPRILGERPGVVNLHLAVDIAEDLSRMKMMYRVSGGYEEQNFYGIGLAKLLDLPAALIADAIRISHELRQRNETRKHSAIALATTKKRKLVLKLREQLLQAKESGADIEHTREWLKRLQEEFIIRMDAIEAEIASLDAQKNTHHSLRNWKKEPEGRFSDTATTRSLCERHCTGSPKGQEILSSEICGNEDDSDKSEREPVHIHRNGNILGKDRCRPMEPIVNPYERDSNTIRSSDKTFSSVDAATDVAPPTSEKSQAKLSPRDGTDVYNAIEIISSPAGRISLQLHTDLTVPPMNSRQSRYSNGEAMRISTTNRATDESSVHRSPAFPPIPTPRLTARSSKVTDTNTFRTARSIRPPFKNLLKTGATPYPRRKPVKDAESKRELTSDVIEDTDMEA